MAYIWFVCSVIAITGSSWAFPIQHLSQDVRIINPNYTDIARRSFTVAITMGMDLLGGGTLVSQRWVLTTASVVQGLDPSQLRVRLGSNSSYYGGKLHKIKTVECHPDYTPDNSTFDLAMIQLDRNVSYTLARHISFLARLPFQKDYAYASVTGFGQERPASTDLGEGEQNHAGETGLQTVDIKIYNRAYCYMDLPETQFCGNQASTPLCDGDIGDPVVRCATDRRCQLMGIYTGYNKCQAYDQASFMDIGQFRDWIKSVILLTQGGDVEYVSWMDSDEQF